MTLIVSQRPLFLETTSSSPCFKLARSVISTSYLSVGAQHVPSPLVGGGLGRRVARSYHKSGIFLSGRIGRRAPLPDPLPHKRGGRNARRVPLPLLAHGLDQAMPAHNPRPSPHLPPRSPRPAREKHHFAPPDP